MEKLLKDQDVAILIETGVNTNSKILIPNNNMEIGKENKMIAIGKEQHQHNGKGTATLVDRR